VVKSDVKNKAVVIAVSYIQYINYKLTRLGFEKMKNFTWKYIRFVIMFITVMFQLLLWTYICKKW